MSGHRYQIVQLKQRTLRGVLLIVVLIRDVTARNTGTFWRIREW